MNILWNPLEEKVQKIVKMCFLLELGKTVSGPLKY